MTIIPSSYQTTSPDLTPLLLRDQRIIMPHEQLKCITKPTRADCFIPRNRFSVTLTCVLIEIFLLATVCDGNGGGGGGYMNPSTYGAYNNNINNQQQYQPQQQQTNQYYGNDQYQQQQIHRDQPTNTNFEEPVVPPPLPPGWSEHIDPSSGQPYYYNSNDGSTTWERPQIPSGNVTVTEENVVPSQLLDISHTSVPSQPEQSNYTESNDSFSSQDMGSVEPFERPNDEIVLGMNEETKPPSVDGDALTSIRRDENQILEEERWRTAQGWTASSDISEDTGIHNSNPSNSQNNPNQRQPSQGWNLPPPNHQPSSGWGLMGGPHGNAELNSVDQVKQIPQSQQDRVPTSNHSQQQQQQQQRNYEEINFSKEYVAPSDTASRPNGNMASPPTDGMYRRQESENMNTNMASPPITSFKTQESDIINSNMAQPPSSTYRSQKNENIQQVESTGQQRGSELNAQIEQPLAPESKQGQFQKIQHQQETPQYLQQPPPTSYSRPPPTQSNPYQYAQQRPDLTGQLPHSQQQGGSAVYSQQQQHPQQRGSYNQQPPQYGGRPMYNQYQPPNQANPQQTYGSQSVGQGGGSLITQEQQNIVKESLGRTWQNILGLKDKTKEVVESATSTVAQSAREATQSIAEKGTGWWGQAKNVLGSVFESEPTSEYSLSGIYGNAPPAPTNQEPPRNYPMNQNYQPQSRYPPQQNFPPQGRPEQNLPPRGAYPPGYGPPQPRVDAPYPHQQQGQRQSMPPIQRELGGNAPQRGYPPQTTGRPYDTEWNQSMRPGQQAPPSQHHQKQPSREHDDSNSAWSHPGLGSDF